MAEQANSKRINFLEGFFTTDENWNAAEAYHSSNGTFVDEDKVQKHDLIDNDILKLGDIEFEFKCRAIREKRE